MASQSDSIASKDGFEETRLMRDLIHLRDTQDAIQALSSWCLKNRKSAYKIARCWLKCVKKVKTEHKLTLFHLVNDIVQHSKRRNVTELIEKFQGVLKEAMPHLKETKICEKVMRCLNIWNERQVFEDKFITELTSIVDPSQNKTADQDILDSFQPTQLCTQIKIMKALEDDTDYKLKTVKESEINLMEIDEASLRQNLKDRQHGTDYINDVEEGRKRLEQYIKAIDREIAKRRQVIDMLSQGGKYYDSLRGEAQIVAQAYTNFGKRVTSLHNKLQDRITDVEKRPGAVKRPYVMLDNSSSPVPSPPDYDVPSPDYDAPSPEADEMELELPDEQQQQQQQQQQHHVEASSSGDLTSRLDSMRDSLSKGKGFSKKESASDNAQPSTRNPPEDMSISEYLTKLARGESTSTPSSQQHDSTSYVPALTDQQSYQPTTDKDFWLRQDRVDGGTASNGAAQPPPLSAWSTGGGPPPATSWPAPRPDPWQEQQQSSNWQQDEPVPEWKLQPEEDEPPDEYFPTPKNGSEGEVYVENVALARLRQRENKDCNLIDLTSAPPPPPPPSGAPGASSSSTKIVPQDDDMVMCGDGDADFDSFAHEQLELHDKFSKPPPNGQEYQHQQHHQQHHRSVNNKPTYGYIPPQKSQQELEQEEIEYQKTLSLQDRLRSLAGVPKDEHHAPPQAAFHSQPPPYHQDNFQTNPPRGGHFQRPPRGGGGYRGGPRGGGPPRGGRWNRGRGGGSGPRGGRGQW